LDSCYFVNFSGEDIFIMSEALKNLQQYVGRSEMATDMVTASAIVKLAATLGVKNPASAKGDPIPPGWHGSFFPASHRPTEMRADGQAAGGGIVPPVPLPRRRVRGIRTSFHQPLRIGDEITCKSEIADITVKEDEGRPTVSMVVRQSITSPLGLAVVEERNLLYLGEANPEVKPAHLASVPAEAVWRREIDPNPVLLFRFSAVRFNSHRIHYDRDYTSKVEGLPGLVVQGTLVSLLLIELCRSEMPAYTISSFGYQTVRQIYDTGPFTIAGAPADNGREAKLWAMDSDGKLAMNATATLVK
jgi:3-methylfumaryl-CoA hydratase